MLFGTDGVRDLAVNILNTNLAFKVGRATASLKNQPIIAVAFDTRLSGKAIERQFIDGATASGARVLECGIMPTPALAYAAYASGADYGVMISASHNPPEYNGIKVFEGCGNKLSLAEEEEIEKLVLSGEFSGKTGKESDGTRYLGEYEKHLIDLVDADFSGTTVTLDCCFGATAHTAPKIFKKLGARVNAVCNSYNGRLVNVYSGATNIDFLKNNLRGGDLAFAFDGDGDRVLGVSSDGEVIDGDRMLYYLADDMLKKGMLNPQTVVGTKMSNQGLGEAFGAKGIKLLRADVGDKYVLEIMRQTGAVLGGEQAGHIIIKNDISTGDGILTAAKMTKLYKEGVNFKTFEPYPQILKNYKADRKILDNPDLIAEFDALTADIEGQGRILVRASGTEPVIRVLVEGKNLEISRRFSIQTEYIIKKFS